MPTILSRAEDAVADTAFKVVFAVVDTVEGWRVDAWRAARAEQRKGVGAMRERHLENASRLREIGWEDKVNQRRPAVAERGVM